MLFLSYSDPSFILSHIHLLIRVDDGNNTGSRMNATTTKKNKIVKPESIINLLQNGLSLTLNNTNNNDTACLEYMQDFNSLFSKKFLPLVVTISRKQMV